MFMGILRLQLNSHGEHISVNWSFLTSANVVMAYEIQRRDGSFMTNSVDYFTPMDSE